MRRIPFGSRIDAERAAQDYHHTLIESDNLSETDWLLVFESAAEKSAYWQAVSGTTDASEPVLG